MPYPLKKKKKTLSHYQIQIISNNVSKKGKHACIDYKYLTKYI